METLASESPKTHMGASFRLLSQERRFKTVYGDAIGQTEPSNTLSVKGFCVSNLKDAPFIVYHTRHLSASLTFCKVSRGYELEALQRFKGCGGIRRPQVLRIRRTKGVQEFGCLLRASRIIRVSRVRDVCLLCS